METKSPKGCDVRFRKSNCQDLQVPNIIIKVLNQVYTLKATCEDFRVRGLYVCFLSELYLCHVVSGDAQESAFLTTTLKGFDAPSDSYQRILLL